MSTRWRTERVEALPPGWLNVYEKDNGGWFAADCPALLHQEEYITTDADDMVHTNRLRPTRVVFADFDGGELLPACVESNYIGTVAPGDHPDSLAEKRR